MWMYETGCALPLTSDFERFVAWVGLHSFFSLQNRNELNLSREQFDEEVRPLLERFNKESVLNRSPKSYGAISRDLTREMLIIDQEAPGFLLARAATRQSLNRGDVSRRLAERAIQAEPEFTAALELLCYLDGDNPTRAFEALGSPLAFTGDDRAASLSGIPRLDLHRLAEIVHTCSGSAPNGLQSIRDIVDIDNLAYTKAWLHTSSDFAERGDIDRAASSASNGLFMATTRAERMQCLVALRDLFDGAGDAFFADIMEENVAQYRRK